MNTSFRTIRAGALRRWCAGAATTCAIVVAVALSAVVAPHAFGSELHGDTSTGSPPMLDPRPHG